MFERASSTESFSRALAASLEQFLGTAQSTRKQVDRALEVADVPTRADVAALGARIDALTAAVDALEEAFRATQKPAKVSAAARKPAAKPVRKRKVSKRGRG
jgi:ABC-type transporter Mla subunit MlaD